MKSGWVLLIGILSMALVSNTASAKEVEIASEISRTHEITSIASEQSFGVDVLNKGEKYKLDGIYTDNNECPKNERVKVEGGQLHYTLPQHKYDDGSFCVKLKDDSGQTVIRKVNMKFKIPDKGSSTIKGDVWLDYNLDNQQNDPMEPEEGNTHFERAGFTVQLWRRTPDQDPNGLPAEYMGSRITSGDAGGWEFNNLPIGNYGIFVIFDEAHKEYKGNNMSHKYGAYEAAIFSDGETDKGNDIKLTFRPQANNDELDIELNKIGDTVKQGIDVLSNDLGPGADVVKIDGSDRMKSRTRNNKLLSLNTAPYFGDTVCANPSGDVSIINNKIYYVVKSNQYGDDSFCYLMDDNKYNYNTIIKDKTLPPVKVSKSAHRRFFARSIGEEVQIPSGVFDNTYYAIVNVHVYPRENSYIEGRVYDDKNLNKQYDDGEGANDVALRATSEYFQKMYSQPDNGVDIKPDDKGNYKIDKLAAGIGYDVDVVNSPYQREPVKNIHIDNPGIVNGGDQHTTDLRLWHKIQTAEKVTDITIEEPAAEQQPTAIGILSGAKGSNGVDNAKLELVSDSVGLVDAAADCDKPLHGTAIVRDGHIEYTPATGITVDSTDEFCYKLHSTYDDSTAIGRIRISLKLAANSSISGMMYLDKNLDHRRQADEPIMPNVPVQLLDSDNNVVKSSTTSADGKYNFTGLKPGKYRVTVANSGHV